MGKSEHHATALTTAGEKVHDKPLPNDETRLRELFTALASDHGPALVVVDQPATIGALPVAVAQATDASGSPICQGSRCAECQICTQDQPRLMPGTRSSSARPPARCPRHCARSQSLMNRLYRHNATEVATQLEDLDTRNRALEGESRAYFATEDVSSFLLESAGWEDLTEPEFIFAVGHGSDVSPRLFQDAMEKVSGDQIDLLAYTPQIETDQSLHIRETVEERNIAVLEFSDTIPEQADGYLERMDQNISGLEGVIDSLE